MAVNTTGKNRLTATQAPAFPFAPVEYQQEESDQFKRILTQYLKQNDNINGALLTPGGGYYLSFPHIAAQDTTSQYTTTDTATKVAWNTLDSGLDFTLNVDNTATASKSGIYKIDYSLQFANTDNALHYVYVWLQVNGTDVAGSGSKFAIPARKSVGNDGYLVAYSSVVFAMNGGDSMALYWATSQAYVASPSTDGVYMEAYGAQTNPFAMPSIPSAIGSIVFVSGLTE